MTSLGQAGVSWRWTALGVAAGLGTGYLLGVVSVRWIWRPVVVQAERATAAAPQTSALVSAIAEIVVEMGRLRQALERDVFSRAPLSSLNMRRVESSADFVSARGDLESEADDEFFDPESAETGGEEASGRGRWEELDELAKQTLESVDVCSRVSEQLRAALEESPGDTGVLWRLSRVLVHTSLHHQAQASKEQELALLEQAAVYGQQALDVDPDCWQAHQWYGIAVGSQVKYMGTQLKIQKGYEYKEHIDAAVGLNPEEPSLHGLLGRFCYEAAGLSWLEKKAATAFFAAPPESSYEEALECFMRSEELRPQEWKANMLFIAKCHIKLEDIANAVEWLHKALHTPVITAEDESSQAEIQALLAEHDSDFTA